jgi:hypothetical protein
MEDEKMIDREKIKRENIAHDKLTANGYRPQGYRMGIKKVYVMKIENENRNDEKQEVYYFNSWHEAAETLIKD